MASRRLRYRTAFFLALAGLATAYMVSDTRIGPPGLIGVCAAVLVGYLGMRETVRRVSGTVYKERPPKTSVRIALVGLVLGCVFVVERLGLGDDLVRNDIFKALVLAFFLSQFMTLLWLIPYERRNGAVRMG